MTSTRVASKKTGDLKERKSSNNISKYCYTYKFFFDKSSDTLTVMSTYFIW